MYKQDSCDHHAHFLIGDYIAYLICNFFNMISFLWIMALRWVIYVPISDRKQRQTSPPSPEVTQCHQGDFVKCLRSVGEWGGGSGVYSWVLLRRLIVWTSSSIGNAVVHLRVLPNYLSNDSSIQEPIWQSKWKQPYAKIPQILFFSQNLGQIDVHKSQRPKKGALTVVVVPKTGVACEMMIDQSVLTDYFWYQLDNPEGSLPEYSNQVIM